MLVPNLSSILASLHFLTLAFAAPITTTPSPVPDPFLSPRSHPASLSPRFTALTVSTTAPATTTRITLTLTSTLLPPLAHSLTSLLLNAYASILAHIAAHGDDFLPNGVFNYMGERGLELNVRNANNHQTTYGVLGAACVAVVMAMEESGVVGQGRFAILDGGVEVGRGRVG